MNHLIKPEPMIANIIQLSVPASVANHLLVCCEKDCKLVYYLSLCLGQK